MTALPQFLRPLAEKMGEADAAGVSIGAEVFLRAPAREAVPSAQSPHDPASRKESAVLVLVCGSSLETAAVVVEERAHTMRSQPAQFALPGGRVDSTDSSHVAAALREAEEEIGLSLLTHPDLQVIGAFTPVRLPVRAMDVTPVLAWHPSAGKELLATLRPQPSEVERVIVPQLAGPGSLSDPTVVTRAKARGVAVGIAFDLPLEPHDPGDDAFVWGFTAALLGGLLTHLIPGFEVAADLPAVEVPTSRLQGEKKASEMGRMVRLEPGVGSTHEH